MATLNLGRIKPVFKGAYSGSTAYVVDDIVTDGNETFICILASTGNATSNATYWTKMAAKGGDVTQLTTQGDILYRDGSGVARLPAGTSGQALISGGAGANVSWGDIDLQGIKSDIATLAIREATNEASASFNLANSFVDTYNDENGLSTKTNVSCRDGVLSTSTYTGGRTANTKFLVDGVDASNPFTCVISGKTASTNDISGTGGTPVRDTSNSKWGSNAVIDLDNGTLNYGALTGVVDWTKAFTIEFWHKFINNPSDRDRFMSVGNDGSDPELSWGIDHDSTADFNLYQDSDNNDTDNISGFDLQVGNRNWNHHAFVKKGDNPDTGWAYYFNGTRIINDTASRMGNIADEKFRINGRPTSSGGSEYYDAFVTDFMIHQEAKYTGASFTGGTLSEKAGTSFSATGTGIMKANTVSSARTKVGGTFTYKDKVGTASIGTDVKVYFSCNGGSNWTEASSYNAITPEYSSGVKMVRCGETTCTSGTDIRYKVEFANQASSSKETELHAIGINY